MLINVFSCFRLLYTRNNFEICHVAWLTFVNFDHINPVSPILFIILSTNAHTYAPFKDLHIKKKRYILKHKHTFVTL